MTREEQIKTLRDHGRYRRKLAGMEPHDDYDQECIAEAEAFETAAKEMEERDARDRRMKAKGAAEELRRIAKEQDEHAAPQRALITSAQLEQRAAELEAAGEGE